MKKQLKKMEMKKKDKQNKKIIKRGITKEKVKRRDRMKR